MHTIITLTKRNTKLFLRDKITVFFSVMSTLILIMLYFLFIAKTYANGMDGMAMPLDMNARYFLIYLQMMAGVLILNSMSLSTGTFSTIARDFESSRIDCFLLAPVKKSEWIASYYLTGLGVGFSINLFTWVLSYCIIGLRTGYWLGIGAFLSVAAALLAASLFSCSLMLLVTAAVKSPTAIGVFNGVSGTFFGFLCGIYMPFSQLGKATERIGSALPFTHLTVWIKRIMLGDAFTQLGIPENLQEILYSEFFSASSVGFLGLSAPLWLMVLLCLPLALICLFFAYRLLKKRTANNAKTNG